MSYDTGTDRRLWNIGVLGSVLVVLLGFSKSVVAQDAGRLDAGTVIPVRTSQAIDVDRQDNRVYTGTVDADVRGDRGRIVVPRGSSVELFVRVAPDNDLILDLESIVANGIRYAVKAEPQREEARRDNSLVGSIVGAISGGQVQGRIVRIPRDSILTFRLERSLDVGVPDRGIDRNGWHYHDRDDRDYERDRR
jgi:hypothetical protein